MTSNGFGFAAPPAGLPHLFALAPDCCAITHLRSVLQLHHPCRLPAA